MERMTGIDPMFIYSDTPETPMEVAYAVVADPATAEEGYSFDRVRALLEARIPTLAPLRRRLMPVPLGLDHPRWVEDPEFEVANHLYRQAIPSPGGDAEFAALVADVMGRPLRPGMPPWEMHVVEGLAGGMVGVIAKMHHSVVDGVAGQQLLAQLLDLTPETREVTDTSDEAPPTPDIGQLPSHSELMSDALPSVLNSPVRVVRAVREVGRTAVRLVRCAIDERTGPVVLPVGAPPMFESPVSARRVVAFAALDMAEVRVVKDRYRSTINDVVLAVCSGALRAHLAEHDLDVDTPLVAVVPVSVREEQRLEATGNQLSAMFVPLANDCKTPLERLRAVSAASSLCKGQERAVGYGPAASLLADALPPAVARPVIQLGVRSGILRRLRVANLMISNVPGPGFPLYLAGMQLRAVYPLGPVVEGFAVNITVQGYCESLFVGINASALGVPDPAGLAGAMVDELSLLGKMAVAATAGPNDDSEADTT
jgi:diacylglycerol O-acyltransferase / wax synthase